MTMFLFKIRSDVVKYCFSDHGSGGISVRGLGVASLLSLALWPLPAKAFTPLGQQTSEVRAGPHPGAAQSTRALVLFVGQVRVIDRAHSNVVRVAVGNGGLLNAKVVENRQIVLLGLGAGDTTVHLWMKDGSETSFKVVIHSEDIERIRKEVQTLMQDHPEIQVRALGNKVLLEGAYRDVGVAARVRSVLTRYPDVLNLVQDDLPAVKPIRLDAMIHLDLRVVEVRKRALDQLGIKWANSADGPMFATSVLGYSNATWAAQGKPGYPAVNTTRPAVGYLGWASQITSALQFLEQSGDSWTLAEPRLSCKSGGKSKFVAGGEIPIPVSMGLGQTSVVYKQYGVVIEFNPVADAEGNIESGIEVEVSEPDPRNSNQGFVAFTTNRTTTQVALKQNTPLVISGLLRQQGVKAMDGIPGLSKLPVLGGMFRTHEARNEETELLVIVTPRFMSADSPANSSAMNRAQALIEENLPLHQQRLAH